MGEQDTLLRWLGYASHDVANPVTALRLLAELALGGAEGTVKEDLEDIMAEADYETVLLDSMGRVASRLRGKKRTAPMVRGGLVGGVAVCGSATRLLQRDPFGSGARA